MVHFTYCCTCYDAEFYLVNVILLNAILVIVILMNVMAPLHFFTLSIVLYIFIRKKLTPTPTLNFIFK
jgi:hypothetical protein